MHKKEDNDGLDNTAAPLIEHLSELRKRSDSFLTQAGIPKETVEDLTIKDYKTILANKEEIKESELNKQLSQCSDEEKDHIKTFLKSSSASFKNNSYCFISSRFCLIKSSNRLEISP